MTETPPDPTFTESDISRNTAGHIGRTTLEGIRPENDSAVSVADLVTVRSAHIYEEFQPFAQDVREGIETELKTAREKYPGVFYDEQLSVPLVIHRFAQSKAQALFKELGKHPALQDSRPPLPTDAVTENLRRFLQEYRQQKPSLRKAFRNQQVYTYVNKQADPHKMIYPEVMFAQNLREAFGYHREDKLAIYTNGVLIALGKTIAQSEPPHPGQMQE